MVIVAAVDNSDSATDVIREAETIAEAFEDTIHVVHVLSRSKFVELGRTSVQENDPIDMDRVREIAKEIASEIGDELSVSWRPVGLVGNPSSRIADYADKQDARYIVIAGRKRSPTGKAMFGSTTQSVILNSPCSVVTNIQ